MKDEHDKSTAELLPTAQAAAVADPPGQTRAPAGGKAKRKPERKPFNMFRSAQDDQSLIAPKPKCAKVVIAHGMFGGSFVPVSFVAKDWNVSTRRIRALLAEGRLQENGYWEVRFPYQFTLGTRGPGLKRQQRPPGKPKNPEAMRNGNHENFDKKGENHEYGKTRNSFGGWKLFPLDRKLA